MSERPSYLEVDRRFLAGDDLRDLEEDPAWAAHLAELRSEEPVRDWVRALAAEDEDEDEVAPEPGRELVAEPIPLQGAEGRRARARWWPVAAALLAALVLLVALPPRPTVTAKGGTEVVVHVSGPDGSRRWEGEPLDPGGRLRLELVGFDAPFYAVVHLDDGDAILLAAGPTPADGLVPGAWAVDESVAGERLVVLGLADDPGSRDAAALLTGPASRAEITLR